MSISDDTPTQTVNALEKGEESPESHISGEGQTPPPRTATGPKWALIVISILSSILLYSLDNTIVANIIPSVIHDLGNAEDLPWISVGYMIGGLLAALPSGKLYALFNAKWLYIICIVLFLAGSALCGAAPNMPAMIVGRVIAGVGGNGMYVGVLTLISVNTSNKERPTYLSFIGLVYGIGTVIGPIIGGAFASSSATWRWGFYINLVVGGLFSPVYIFILPSFDPQPNLSITERFKLYDGVGTLLSIVGLLCTVMAINFGGTLFAWNSGSTIALFVVGILGLIAFAFQQKFKWLANDQNRLFPVHFLRMKEPVLLFILMACNNCSSMVLMYYIPLYFQFTRSVGSLDSGVRLLPFIVAATVFIFANGAILSATGLYKPWYVFGTTLILIGGVCISRITVETADWYIYGFQLMLGVGLGSFLQSGYSVMQGIMDPVHMAYGVSFMLFAQLLGISLGLSIGGTVFINTALSNLGPALPGVPRSQLQSALSGTSGDFLSHFDSEVTTRILDIIVDAIDTSFILVYVAGAVGLLASVLLSNQRLNRAPTST